jgi:hypothetical protein
LIKRRIRARLKARLASNQAPWRLSMIATDASAPVLMT